MTTDPTTLRFVEPAAGSAAGESVTGWRPGDPPMSVVPDDPGSLGTVLSIWAHPDDETYLAAGVMAAARDLGSRVVCATASAGELGTSDPGTWPPERLGPVRRWEIAAALAVLGVVEHHHGSFPDGAFDRCEDEGVAWAGRLLDEVDPDTVLTFGPDGMTFHPDHQAVHRWVTEAWRRRGRRSRLLCATTTVEHIARFGPVYEEWGMYMSDGRPVGVPTDRLALHVVLGGAALDRKLTALRALASQTGGLLASVDPDVYAAQVAEECFVDAFRLAGAPVLS